jgi:hypothetical protein
MYILDTNVISELRHGKPSQSLEVRAWASDKPASHLFISAISMLELEKGVLALARRTQPQDSALRPVVQSNAACLPDLPICRYDKRGDKIGGQNPFEGTQLHEHQTTTRLYPD